MTKPVKRNNGHDDDGGDIDFGGGLDFNPHHLGGHASVHVDLGNKSYGKDYDVFHGLPKKYVVSCRVIELSLTVLQSERFWPRVEHCPAEGRSVLPRL